MAFVSSDVLVAFVAGVLVGELRRRLRPLRLLRAILRREDLRAIPGRSDDGVTVREAKMVLCVRTDLKMKKGKIGAQCGHAAIGAYEAAQDAAPVWLNTWIYNAQPKIALQIASEREARELAKRAKQRGLCTYTVYDAGRTQVKAGSLTVLAIGPGPADEIDSVTGHLKLL